ncbi:Ribokinase-like protein [Gautieria morchelliformis]|nr:Ribokinase-like protein [Gautieria morchelliformis]
MDGRVLSIQSHVASGYVGGKAAVFPLQLLGYDVDVGYGRIGGWKSSAEELSSVFDGMEKNGLLNPSRLLTGYVPGVEALTVISKIVRRLRRRNPELVYLLDPVMGDAGKLYVSGDVVPIYRELICQATIITPNYFEVELLTQIQINSVSSLRKIFRILHKEYKVPHVVISSIPLSDALAGTFPEWLRVAIEKPDAGEPLLCVTSSALAEELEVPSVVHSLYIPRIPGYFSGVGDLFSALVLAHFHNTSSVNDPSQTPLSSAVAKSCQTTHALLRRTQRHSMSLPAEDRTISDPELDARDIDRKVRRMKGRELRLVKDQGLILGKDLDADGSGLQEMREWVQFWSDT